MNIVRKNITNMLNAIIKIQKDPVWKGAERAYLLLKIRKGFEETIKNIGEIEKVSSEVEEFFNKRNDILIKNAQLDDAGKPKIVNNSYVLIEEKKKECFDILKKLEEEYKNDIDKENEKRKEFAKFMEESESLNIPFIKKELIPEDVLPEDLWNIKELLEEEI